jgi:predicted ATPase/class 3 adenylate cyclase
MGDKPVRCQNCSSENPQGAKFCIQCATPFRRLCEKCGFENPPQARFCAQCATSLTGDQVGQPPSAAAGPVSFGVRVTLDSPEAQAIEGERKTVTALFADIKGSTELMRDLDPEEARAIVDPVLQLMMAAVHRYGGYVAQSTGDGIFALFGAPVAHEDHPQRALHAALAIQEDLRRYAARLRTEDRIPVEARVGVNTGEVVVRTIETGGHTEYTPVGHVTNLAARMQAAAPTGSIAAGEATQRLCEGYFEFRSLGPTAVKGLNAPVKVYEVVRAGPLRSHFELSTRRGLTRFVGREREMSAMAGALGQARTGHGQIVAAVGEAGAGKSRLVYEFKTTIPAECKVLEAYSVSHGKASAWLPVLELLKSYFEIADEDDDELRSKKVEAKVRALDPALAETLPYFLSLLSIAGADASLAVMDARIRRRRTLEAVKRIIIRESLKQPLVVIFEDLHWIDAETQEFLDLLVDSVASARILMLVNYRPEYRHEWGNRACYTQLRLDPLGDQSADKMLHALIGGDASLQSLKRLIIEKTRGNPFFMEEIVLALVEQGVLVRNGATRLMKPLTQIYIPPTVHGILASRIDALPASGKSLLQTLAVIGKDFPLNLVKHITGSPEELLEPMLKGLQAGEFIYEQAVWGEAAYAFKHALTQEVAYSSLLAERRKLLHERVGAAMEVLYAGRLDDHLSELARHYQRSGNTGKALEYLQRAGRQAIARSSHAEAVGLFRSALELLNALPGMPDSVEQELTLQLGIGSALSALKGWSAPEVGRAFDRASELCRQVDSTPHLSTVVLGLCAFHNIRGELRRAFELIQELLAIAENESDTTCLLWAHSGLGEILCVMGEFASARSHLEHAISLYDPAKSESYRALYLVYDPGVASLSWASVALCCLGYPDQALERSLRALALARALSHPFSIAYALALSAGLHHLRREGEASLTLANEYLRLSTENGFERMSAFGVVDRGSALIELNRAEQGIVQLEEGIAKARATRSEYTLASYLAALGNGYGKAGRAAEGLAAVAEGLDASEKSGERSFEAELYRLRGELLLKHDAPVGSKVEDEAQGCFRQALEIARRQQARWWELRATMSLARVLDKRGRRDEACTMLAEIFGWFTEGFGTADLKDAKALLDQLNE